MEADIAQEAVTATLLPVAENLDVLVEEVKVNLRSQPASVAIIVDSPKAEVLLDLDQIAEISRAFSAALDEADPLDVEYILEVSSRGAEAALVCARHFLRNLGRKINVKTKAGLALDGELVAADDDGFTLETAAGSRYLEYGEVKRARPRVQFG